MLFPMEAGRGKIPRGLPMSLGSVPRAGGKRWMAFRICLNGRGKYRNKPSCEGKLLQAQHNFH